MQSYTIDGLVVMPPLTLEYSLDESMQLRHQILSFEQGFSFDYHNALYNANNVTFNRFSNFYLTDTYLNTEIFDIQDIPYDYPHVETSFLAFNRLDSDPMSALTADNTCLTSFSAASALSAIDTVTTYITIEDSISTTDESIEYRDAGLNQFLDIKTGDTMYQKYYFTIMYINASDCVIYHESNNIRWYLSHEDKPDEFFKFVKTPHDYGLDYNIEQIIQDGGTKIIFKYAKFKHHNLIRLYKEYQGSVHVLKALTEEERDLQPDAVPIRLVDIQDADYDITTPAPNMLELTADTTIRIRPTRRTTSKENLNSSITKYRQTSVKNNIDVSKHHQHAEKVNNILHSEYYYLTAESLPVNFIPLKNTQTPHGICSSNNISDDKSPNNHRVYNKVFTGTNQLQGSSNIALDYTATTVMYTFNPGMNYFNTPDNIDPYVKLNINDSTLYRSGSIAANHPALSDKIYKKRSNYSKTTRWGNPADIHTGTWLCTWLSGGDDPSIAPVWMDRYYEPNNIGYVDALTSTTDHIYSEFEEGEVYEHPGDDLTNTTMTGTTAVTAVTANDALPIIPAGRVTSTGNVYDEPSKLTFEPGCHYAYYRLNSSDIVNNLSVLEPYHLKAGTDVYKTRSEQTLEPIDNTVTLNGNNLGIINKQVEDIDTEQLSIDFDIKFKDLTKPSGHQILGNCTNTGIGFFNDNAVSPFMFIPAADGTIVEGKRQGSSIRIYDNTYKLYNYVTNDSFLDDDEPPGLFEHIIIRELCEDIFCVMSNGKIIQITHDGIVSATYTQWCDYYNNIIGSTIVDVTYDEKMIYILTHINDTYYVDTFNMVNKSFNRFESQCIVDVPVPEEFSILSISNDTTYGNYIDTTKPPNKIYIKDDPPPFHNTRTLYVGYGDQIKSGSQILWYLVKGQVSETTGSQQKHDCIYGFDTKSLKLLEGKINDNSLAEPDLLLEVLDYAVDSNDSIWLCHNTNYVSKFTKTRKIESVQQIEEQQILSMVINRDYDDTGDIVEQAVILSKTIGEEEIQLQIGPNKHPTNDPSNEDFRKASPWLDLVLEPGEKAMLGIESVTIDKIYRNGAGDAIAADVTSQNGISSKVNIDELTQYRNTRPDTIIYDADIDSTQIIYPFVDGNNRFGIQIDNRHNLPSIDLGGKVVDGDYLSITEGFDYIVTEVKDEMYGNIFDINTGRQVFVRQLTDFAIDDANDKPQIQNHYEYSLQNYRQYSNNNFNVKIFLQPLFKADNPDEVILKIDLDNLKTDDKPYTDYIHITLNINNTTGRIELWIDGQLDENVHVYNFPPQKYRFINLLNRNILVGTSPYLQETILNKKLNNRNQYNVTNVDLRDICIYNRCIDYHHQLNIMRKRDPIEPMTWDIPNGSRNYTDTIDKVFNHSIPPRKANMFNLVIKNSRIQSAPVQNYINNKILNSINDIIPAGTGIKNISWTNELVETSD